MPSRPTSLTSLIWLFLSPSPCLSEPNQSAILSSRQHAKKAGTHVLEPALNGYVYKSCMGVCVCVEQAVFLQHLQGRTILILKHEGGDYWYMSVETECFQQEMVSCLVF